MSRRFSADPSLDGLDVEPSDPVSVDEELTPAPASQSPRPVPSVVPEELSAPPDAQADTCPIPPLVPEEPAISESSTVGPLLERQEPGNPFLCPDDIVPSASEPSANSGPRRSSRSTRRPAYLQDYVT